MTDSMQYKTLRACFHKLVLALKADPVAISNELVAAGLIPPPDGQIEAQQLAQRILDVVKVVPARYDDVLTVLSKHDWLKDIVEILQTTRSEILIGKHGKDHEPRPPVTADMSLMPSEGDKSQSAEQTEQLCMSDQEGTPASRPSEAAIEYDCPHTSSDSLPISNPIIHFEDLNEDDREDLFAQMNELTKKVNSKFKKLLNRVYESLRKRVELGSVILTLTEDDVMIFDQDDKLDEARDMFDVFKAIRPHCSYFNYDLLKLLVDVHGSSEDKAHFEEYLQSFTSYCEAVPCAEEICGNGDSQSKRIKLLFKVNFDRQRLKTDALRCVKCNIANHLKIKPSSLYLRNIKEGCVSLEFLIPSFLFGRIFPLSDEQKAALYNEEKVIAIQCEDPNLLVDVEKDVLLLAQPNKGHGSNTRMTDHQFGTSASSVASSGYLSNCSPRGSTYQLMAPPKEFHHFPSKYQRPQDRPQTMPIPHLETNQVDERVFTAPHQIPVAKLTEELPFTLQEPAESPKPKSPPMSYSASPIQQVQLAPPRPPKPGKTNMSSLLPIDVTHEDEADDHDVPTALSPYALMSENQNLQCKVRKLVSEKEVATNRFFEARVAVLGFLCRTLQLQGELTEMKKDEQANVSHLQQQLNEALTENKTLKERNRVLIQQGGMDQALVQLEHQVAELNRNVEILQNEKSSHETINFQLQQDLRSVQDKKQRLGSSSSSTPTAPVPTPQAIKVKQLEEDISKLHKQVESLQQRNSELERELQSASSLTASTDVDVISLQMKVAQLEDQNKKLKEANSRNVDRMTEEISRLQLSGLSSDQTVNHLRQQLSMNEQQVREKDQEIIKLQQEKYQFEQSLASMRVENERLDGERKILERERDRLKEEVQNSPIAEQAPQLGRSNSVRDQGVLRRLNNTLRDKKQLEEKLVALNLEVNNLKAGKQAAEQGSAVKIQQLEEENERVKTENERVKREQLAKAEQENQLLQQQLAEQGAELREIRQNLEWREREMSTLQEERTCSEQLLRQQLEEYKESAETELSDQKTVLEATLAEKDAELSEVQGQLEGLSIEKQSLEAAMEMLKSDYQALKSTNEKETTTFRSQLQQLQHDRDKAKVAQDEVKGELKVLQDAKKKGENLQDALKKEAEYIMTDLEEVNARLSTTEQERDKAIHQKDKAMNELSKRNREIQQKEEMIKKLDNHLKAKDEQMSILDIQLQTYHSDFETERKSREKMAGKMEQMKEELDKKDQEVKRLRSHLNKSAAIQMKAEMAQMEYYTSEGMDDSLHYATVGQSQMPFMTEQGQEPLRARDPERTHPPPNQGTGGQYQMHAPSH